MLNVLVTGGAGFIGSNFIHYLFNKYGQDIRVCNVDALTYAGNLKNLATVKDFPNYQFYNIRIEDKESLEKEIFSQNKFDLVINFAAESHVDRSILGSKEFVVTNILGTQTLLDCSRKYNVDRFIQISTDEVYGSLGDTGQFTENTPISPNSPYAASKAGADILVQSYVHTHKFPAIITRCSNNYGPYQFPEKLIPLMISNALEGKPLPVYGKGENVRDWIYVEDHSNAIDLIMQRGKIGEVYNIGGNSEYKNIDIVKLILENLNKPENLIKFVTDRLGHDFRYAMDYSKLNKELGWQPKVSFKDGLEKTIKWYLDNEDWLEEVKSGEYREYYEKLYG